MGFVVDTDEVERLAAAVVDTAARLQAFSDARALLDGLAAELGSVPVHRAASLVTEGWGRVVDTINADLQICGWLLGAGAGTYVTTDMAAAG
jgi:hypothetical protein